MAFLKSERLELLGNGDATFSGTVRVKTADNAVEMTGGGAIPVAVLRASTTTGVLASADNAARVSVSNGGSAEIFAAKIALSGNVHTPLHDKGDSGSSLAIDWSAGNFQSVRLTASTTVTLASGASGGMYRLVTRQDSTGGRSVTWPAGVLWSGGVVVQPTSGAHKLSVFTLLCIGPDTYLASVAGDYGTGTALPGPFAAPSALSGTGTGFCAGSTAVYEVQLSWTNGDSSAETQLFRTGSAAALATLAPGVTSATVPSPAGGGNFYARHLLNSQYSAQSNMANVFIALVTC